MDQLLAFLDSSFDIYGRTYRAGDLVVVLLLVLLGWYVIRKLEALLLRAMQVRNTNPDMIMLVRRIYLILAWVLLGLMVLRLLGIPITAFAFVSGAIAIGVGFGAQNIINNFISGWILMWEKPIRIGDTLEVGGMQGSVESINTRSTRIRRFDGVYMLVPNSFLLENVVINWTLMGRRARGVVLVSVAYGSPARTVAELIMQAATEHKDIAKEPKPQVYFSDFADMGMKFELAFWIDGIPGQDIGMIKSDIRYRVEELFAKEGIALAYRQQDVHLDGELKLIPPGTSAPAAASSELADADRPVRPGHKVDIDGNARRDDQSG